MPDQLGSQLAPGTPEVVHCEDPTKNFELITKSLGNASRMGDPHTGDPRD